MKKIYIVAFATIIIGGIIFSSCQKDENLVTNAKMLKSAGDIDLKFYELYTPEEDSIEAKLLLITDYVNNPDENTMPDMELKEAIWFLEMFFNIGVCQKQNYAVDTANLSKTYSITIPFAELDGADALFLDGQELQENYINLLQEIIEETDSDYSINFGDMYVSSINSETITIDLEIKYGKKGTELSSSSSSPGFPMLKIVSSTFSPVIYPYPNANYIYTVYPSYRVKDEGMTITLNQETTMYCPVGIIGVKAETNNANNVGYFYNKTLRYGDSDVWLTNMDYDKYGNTYRNVIWNNLAPIALSGYPSNYVPLWAGCYLENTPGNDLNSYICHEYAIEKICSFYLLIQLSRWDEIRFHPAGII